MESNEEDDKYKRKYQLLIARCETIQAENEQTVRHILRAKRNLRKARRLRLQLLEKLDSFGDPWRDIQLKSLPAAMTNGEKVESAEPASAFGLPSSQAEGAPKGNGPISPSQPTEMECSPKAAEAPDLHGLHNKNQYDRTVDLNFI